MYALFNDGTVQTFHLPSAVSPVAETVGGYTSTHNLATTWSNNTNVSRKLGNPTQAAQVAMAGTQGGGGGIVQRFDGGLLVYPHPDVRRIYALYNTSGYAYVVQGPHLTLTDINRWSAYPDTYQP